MNKKIMIIVMASIVRESHAMMSVQAQGMPMRLPQAFVQASPVLQAIEAKSELADLKKRALFADQDARVVQRVIDDQKRLSSNAGEIEVGYRGMEYCLVLARRLELVPLLAEYRARIRNLIP